MSKTKIDSWEQLQQQIKSIIVRINKDQRLALAAAVNPLFALEELGFELSPGARRDIGDRLRFGQNTAMKLKDLRASIFKQVGHPFDIDSPAELGRVLFDELKLSGARVDLYEGGGTAQQPPAKSRRSPPPDIKPLPRKRPGAEPVADPLEGLKGVHPVVGPLLEYRRLEASRPRFAPRSFFEAVRRGERPLPVREIRARFKAGTGRK
jgi:hypothetical protein